MSIKNLGERREEVEGRIGVAPVSCGDCEIRKSVKRTYRRCVIVDGRTDGRSGGRARRAAGGRQRCGDTPAARHQTATTQLRAKHDRSVWSSSPLPNLSATHARRRRVPTDGLNDRLTAAATMTTTGEMDSWPARPRRPTSDEVVAPQPAWPFGDDRASFVGKL